MRSTLGSFVLVGLLFAVPAAGSTPAARILFNEEVGSHSDVVAVAPDASGFEDLTPVRTTFHDSDQDPSWAPDGSRIAFVSQRDSNVGEELYVMNADGSDQRRLTTDGPTGVATNSPDLFNVAPVWSPDGHTIAFIKSRGNEDVWLIAPDGTGQRRLTMDGGQKTFLQWSPDGTRLLYEHENAIYVVPAEGRGSTRVATGGDPVWSPDGSRIAFGFDGLWVTRADGTGQSHLTTLRASAPSWSADGTKIAFEATRPLPEYYSRYGPYARTDLFTIAVDGKELRRLTGPADDSPNTTLVAGQRPTWWPDDSRIFFLSSRAPTEAPTTYVMNADGSCEHKFVDAPIQLFRPTWRPGALPGLRSSRCTDLRLVGVLSPGLQPPVRLAALNQVTPLDFALDNDGNEPATNVRVEATATTPETRVQALGAARSSCTGTDRRLVCDFARLAPQASAQLALGVRATSAGIAAVNVRATSSETDVDPRTNEATLGVRVFDCTDLGTSGDDFIRGTTNSDKLCGLDGADRLEGAAGDDVLKGGPGNDILSGGRGRDTILGKGGEDIVYARDGERDTINCGSGRDIAIVDRIDSTRGCETVVQRHR